MKYRCTETTFYDQIYNPGDEFNSIPDDDFNFNNNPCWVAEPVTAAEKAAVTKLANKIAAETEAAEKESAPEAE